MEEEDLVSWNISLHTACSRKTQSCGAESLSKQDEIYS
jgi:hypothetical protein